VGGEGGGGGLFPPLGDKEYTTNYSTPRSDTVVLWSSAGLLSWRNSQLEGFL